MLGVLVVLGQGSVWAQSSLSRRIRDRGHTLRMAVASVTRTMTMPIRDALLGRPPSPSISVADRHRLAGQAADPHVAKVMSHSQRNGRYFSISDLHWGFGPGDPRECFLHDDVLAKTLRWITRDPQNAQRNKTLIIGGDWLDLAQHLLPHTPIKRQLRTITQILEAHAPAVRALASAVVDDGLRVIYLRGNHDIQLVDPQIRAHFVEELGRVAGLSPERRRALASGMAYSGFATTLGGYGEGIVLHGSDQDAFNKWRSPINPYDVTGQHLQWNVGWRVAQVYSRLRRGNSGPGKTALQTMLRPSALKQLARLLASVASRRPTNRADMALARVQDRYALRSWVELTGFHRQMDGRGARSVDRWTDTWQRLFDRMPGPLHEQMVGPRLLNMLRIAASRLVYSRDTRRSIGAMTTELMGEAGRTRAVEYGHSHREAASVEQIAGTHVLGSFNDTGTWTRDGRLDVVTADTDTSGHLLGTPRSYRVDQTSGAALLPPPKKTIKPKLKILGWEPLSRMVRQLRDS
jgi:hypothetical protein